VIRQVRRNRFEEESRMGDQPYAMLLPWILFAVVARHSGEGITWGAIAALIAAIALLVTSRPEVGNHRNTVALGAIGWFTALGFAGLLWDHGGVLTRYSRAVSAVGFVLIAVISLAYRPATEYYARAYVRPRLWSSHGFLRLNYQLTLLWAAIFAGIVASHCFAAVLRIDQAYTVFNWVVPISLCAIGAHVARSSWYDWTDELELEDDTLHALGLDFTEDWDTSS
jgi:hypothetical protein